MSNEENHQDHKPDREPGHETAPAENQGGSSDREKKLTVVGIGASAGGLAALQGFFDALPSDTGMAFVVVTHMDPERESHLPEILQTRTALPVQQVRALVPIEPDHVYVISPNRRILITDTHLDSEEFQEPRGRRTPIDYFFRTLANVHRAAVAIILSGGGTDGAVGVKAIKEEGGLLLVQDPDEAEYDSMPRAAIATGLADVVLPVAELVAKLVAYYQNGVRVPESAEALTEEELQSVYHILTQVQVHTGHDFSQYKRSTILRRIQRRMQLGGFFTFDAYLAYLRHNGEEAQILFNDLLIGVTNFFRDRDAWDTLAEEVIPRLFEGKKQGDTVRVWSIGCATGEEAYTLAILLMEHAATLERPALARPELQVFASDLDDGALGKAREGIYPEAIEADVTPERLERFFVKDGHYYSVRQELRDVVLFSNHSVLRDPPFSRLDLVSCRNLLIYLNRELQQNVFQIFHYALRPEKYLFLGSAESAEMVHESFQTMDKHHRIYRARPQRGEHPRVPALPLSVRHQGQLRHGHGEGARHSPVYGGTPHVSNALHQQTLEELAPPSVLVDAQHQVLHVSESAGRYLLHPRGTVTVDLLKLIRPELAFELRNALFHAFDKDEAVISRPVYVQFNGAPHRVLLSVSPYARDETEPLALVFFLEDERREAPDVLPPADGDGEEGRAVDDDALLTQLEDEVRRLRERLQATTEEYESSNEELKAANEELQSINEEYRSTTEELETSKEELQSVNEELQTVNAELKNKLEEVSRAHSDLENLMAATEIATLFLDRDLRIQRYTPKTTELFNIMPGDRGRPIEHLTHKLTYETLPEDARQVLRDLIPIEREIHQKDGDRWLLVRLRPYRTTDDRIDGVILTFVDVSELKETQAALQQRERELALLNQNLEERVARRTEELQAARDLFYTLFHGNPLPMVLTRLSDGLILDANEAYLEYFGLSRSEVVGRTTRELEMGLPTPERDRVVAQMRREKRVRNLEMDSAHPSGETRTALVSADIVDLDGTEAAITAFVDITERRKMEEQLRELAAQLTMAEQDERARIAQILHDDLQQQLYALQMEMATLRDQSGEEAVRQALSEMEAQLKSAAETSSRLSADLLPPVLDNQNLVRIVEWLAGEMRARHGLEVDIIADGDFSLAADARRTLFFQVLRETLFNVVKHAGVARARVEIDVVEDAGLEAAVQAYRVVVEDEGAGFEPHLVTGADGEPAGRGLHYAQKRLALIGGRMEVESAPGAGTRITLLVPHAP